MKCRDEFVEKFYNELGGFQALCDFCPYGREFSVAYFDILFLHPPFFSMELYSEYLYLILYEPVRFLRRRL